MPFVPLPGDYRQLLASKQGLELMRGKPVKLVSKQLLEAMLTTAAAAMAGTDLLLVTPLALWGYHSVSLLKWRQDSRVIQAWRRERGLALPASVYVLEECPHSWLFPQLKGRRRWRRQCGGRGRAGSRLVMFTSHDVRLWTFDGRKVSFFSRHLGCWTRGVMLQAQAQALEPPA